jgi:aminopeptidase-like protein
MNKFYLNTTPNINEVGQEMYQLMSELYPICRSITGNGVRETLKILKKHIPLTVHEVPTGTKVFDWTIPKEWNIKDAYIKDSKGVKVIDFKKSNLHVLNYSLPIKKKVSLRELKEHLFTLPQYPDWIPYKTSYYNENWGFCLSHNQFLELKDEEYEVFIDSSLEKGHLTYGEYYIEGEKTDEVLISCHMCHPSLCNDNLSGIVVTAFLAKYLGKISSRYSYRFLYIPATIGAITWLALNESKVSRIKHGIVTPNLGDSGKFTYKKSRQGNTEIDQAVIHVLKNSGKDYQIIDFFPYGYDERQYCSPGFNLPVGCLMRSPNNCYPEYHTSADNLDFVKPQFLTESFLKYLLVLNVLENNKTYLNQNPKCETQLGKRGLYKTVTGTVTGHESTKGFQLAMLWVLNLSDGKHSLLDISDRSGLEFGLIKDASDILFKNDLLNEY